MRLRLGRIAFDTRPLVRADGVPEEAGLQASGLGAVSSGTELTRRSLIDRAWLTLVGVCFLPLAARSAFADDDEDEGEDDEDDDDDDDDDVFSPPEGGVGGGF